MRVIGAQPRLAFVDSAGSNRRRMEGIDSRPRFRLEGDHGAVAVRRPPSVEGGYHPETATRVAITGIADLLLRMALAPVAEHRQNGIIEMPGTIEIVGSECNVKKHRS